MSAAVTALLVCLATVSGISASGSAPTRLTGNDAMPVVLENSQLRYVISPQGLNTSFVDRATGIDYCQPDPLLPAARIRIGVGWHDASTASAEDGQVLLGFTDTRASARLAARVEEGYMVLTVTAASDEIDELQFLNLQLTLKGDFAEPFAACAVALNLRTNVPELPGLNSRLRAHSVRRFGIVGAAAALVGCPTAQMRDVLKEVVAAAPDLPKSAVGGPWAMDSTIGRSSYLFANPTEENVEEMIRTLKSIGFNQVQIHGGRGTYRFGDCEPNRDLYPRGIASIKAVIDRLHEEGIYVGMHPYAFFIDKASRWVTPVPDPRLANDASFTLATDLAADATAVPVVESTSGMSLITGFFVRNSVTLQVDDELIVYSELSDQPPYAFTKCQRGALGTTAAVHKAGASVHHLKECFGLFVPDPETTLLQEVAAANAAFYNACGFDALYLDALDGEDILGGSENSWHYGSQYVWELWKGLERPAAMEYSTFHHHLWFLRSRHGAWDHPTRSHKQFIDQHVAGNRGNDRIFLPSNLGWWGFKDWQPAQVEPTYPDDIEYWVAKALGTDSGLSLQGYDPQRPGHQRLAAIVKQYEALRHAGYFPESVKARLRQPRAEFTLEALGSDEWAMRPLVITKHTAQANDELSQRWTVDNPYAAQPPRMRLEALMAAAPYDSPGHVTLAQFDRADEFAPAATAAGVSARLEPVTEGQLVLGRLTATNENAEGRGAWAQFTKVFDPPLDLSGQQGLGVWVRGDGKGEVLNFQMQSPDHISGAVGEHYVIVDFEGWRYFELIEHDSDRYADYAWPYPGGYSVYRETVHYPVVESLTIWCNNLPPGDAITCDLRAVHALPLEQASLSQPQLRIGDDDVTLPVEVTSGTYVEVGADGDCRLYSATGELLEQCQLNAMPQLKAGANALQLTFQASAETSPRTRVTVMTRGAPLQ